MGEPGGEVLRRSGGIEAAEFPGHPLHRAGTGERLPVARRFEERGKPLLRKGGEAENGDEDRGGQGLGQLHLETSSARPAAPSGDDEPGAGRGGDPERQHRRQEHPPEQGRRHIARVRPAPGNGQGSAAHAERNFDAVRIRRRRHPGSAAVESEVLLPEDGRGGVSAKQEVIGDAPSLRQERDLPGAHRRLDNDPVAGRVAAGGGEHGVAGVPGAVRDRAPLDGSESGSGRIGPPREADAEPGHPAARFPHFDGAGGGEPGEAPVESQSW